MDGGADLGVAHADCSGQFHHRFKALRRGRVGRKTLLRPLIARGM